MVNHFHEVFHLLFHEKEVCVEKAQSKLILLNYFHHNTSDIFD